MKLAILILLIPQLSFASIFFGFGTGQFNGNEEMFSAFTGYGEVGYEGFGLGTSVRISVIDQANKVATMRPGRITLIPVQVSLYGRPKVTKNMRVLLGGGVGYVNADRTLDASVSYMDTIVGEKTIETLNNGLEYHVMGGIEYRINSKVYLQATISNMWFDTTWTETRTNLKLLDHPQYVRTAPVELGGLMSFLGVKFKY